MKVLCAIVAVGILTGCTGYNYAHEFYGTTTPQVVSTRHDRFNVHDNTPAGRLLVSVYSPVDMRFMINTNIVEYPKPHFQDAAEAYLAQGGRRCEIYDSSMILGQRWEFRYRCEGAKA